MREYVWWHLTYLTKFGYFFRGIDFKNTIHFWTLAVEEQFYEKPILSLKHRWAPDPGSPQRTPGKSPVGR